MNIALNCSALNNSAFIDSLHSEWLKQRRSLASWMVLVGAFFTPAIIIVARLLQHESLQKLYAATDFWPALWRSAWESAAIFLLPMGAILATSLIVQIEYRNNAWKQVHALPLSLATIYFSKLAIVILMLVQFLVLFNLGIWLSAAVPAWMLPGVAMPAAPIPFADFLYDDLRFFVACLPIVALQYLLSLRFRNFMVPVGVGFMLWVGSLAALSSRWSALSPYAYTMLEYLKNEPSGKLPPPIFDIYGLAIGYGMLFIAVGYALFALRRQKG
jgi:lantibiotic transport system permease protein